MKRLVPLAVVFLFISSPVDCFNIVHNNVPLPRTSTQLPTSLSRRPIPRATSNSDGGVRLHSAKGTSSRGGGMSFSDASQRFCRLSPLWTLLSVGIATTHPSSIGPCVGSLPVMQGALSTLMLAMGLSIEPGDISRAIQHPSIILLNVLLCFGMMPLLAVLLGAILDLDAGYNAGLILLGCVSGGQASNLFALLAGGDVALSVACTVSTTLLGAVAIPLLVQTLLGCTVAVDFVGVFRSVVQLVLFPLMLGLSVGKVRPSMVKRLGSVCPFVGVLSTLILVAGGAATCAMAPSSFGGGGYYEAVAASYLLPILGAFAAWAVSFVDFGSSRIHMKEKARRTLVIETLSKSPTLALVLARKHFGEMAAIVPASGMVSLAIVGAAVASCWAAVDPVDKYQETNT